MKLLMFASMAVVSVVCDASQTKKTLELAELVGDWSGRSRCQVKPSARHDEDVVYHLSHPHEDRITIKADKIVDGKPIPRGGGDWIYHKSSGALTWDAPRGQRKLVVVGDDMDGTLAVHESCGPS
jgi:hypothetical protein